MEESAKPKFWTRKRRLWLIALAALAAVIVGWIWLPGMGLRYGLIRSLHDLGWSRVSILRTDVSLFNGAIVVHRVQAGEDEKSMLGIDGLDLIFRWKPLFSRRVSVEKLDLEGVTVDIHRDGDGFVVNGLPLSVPAGGNDDEAPSRWSYDVSSLSLKNSRIAFSDGTFTADIQVDSLTIEDLKSWEPDTPARFHLAGRLNGAPLTLNGSATPFAATPKLDASVSVDGLETASLGELVRRAGGGDLSGKLTAALTLSGGTDANAAMKATGQVALAGAKWALGTTRIAAGQLRVENLSLGLVPGKVEWSGNLSAADAMLEDGGVAETAGLARVAIRSGGYDFKSSILAWDGTLHAERHKIAVNDIALEHASFDWDGKMRLDLSTKAQSFFHGEGKAQTTDVRIRNGAMTVTAKAITADGVFEHARPNGMLPPLAGTMNAQAEQLLVSEGEMDWVQAERLQITGLALNPGKQASVARAEIHNLGSLNKRGKDPYSWRVRATQAVLEQASLGPDGNGTVNSVSIDGAVVRLTQTKDGLQGLPQENSSGKAQSAANSTPLPRQIVNHIRIGGNSRIEFVDRTRSEAVRMRVEAIEVTADGLDSARPDQGSRFTASARIGNAQVTAKGEAKPFASVPGGEIKGTVRSLELPPLSPYAADTLGVYLHTGQLDADFDLNSDKGKLDGGMQLTLSELFVSQPDPDAPLAKKADMPVETVLDLLRDSENRIRLSIPVRGDLSNPDFDISDAVGQAVGGALRTTVFTTLKVAFPLAGLISLVIDGAEGERLALEPLTFIPGDDTLADGEHKKLDEVAQLMRQRPSLKLTLCGAASEKADWQPLQERRRTSLLERLQNLVNTEQAEPTSEPNRERLSRLADSRAQAAKAYLVDKSAIDPGRLFTCRPRVDSTPDAKPRVDLLL